MHIKHFWYVYGDNADAFTLIAAGCQKLKKLLSFAIGGLLGDVFLHLLPEAWAYTSSPGENSHIIFNICCCSCINHHLCALSQSLKWESLRKLCLFNILTSPVMDPSLHHVPLVTLVQSLIFTMVLESIWKNGTK